MSEKWQQQKWQQKQNRVSLNFKKAKEKDWKKHTRNTNMSSQKNTCYINVMKKFPDQNLKSISKLLLERYIFVAKLFHSICDETNRS